MERKTWNTDVIPYYFVNNINEHDIQVSCYRWYDKSGSENDMKIDRLIGILSVLLQEEKVTAPELAERFEVSGRTKLCYDAEPAEMREGMLNGIYPSDKRKFRERTHLLRNYK